MQKFRIVYSFGQGKPRLTEDISVPTRNEAVKVAEGRKKVGRFKVGGKEYKSVDIKDYTVSYIGPG